MNKGETRSFPIPRDILKLIGSHNARDLFSDEDDSSDTDADIIDCDPKPTKRYSRSFYETPKFKRQQELTNYLGIFRRYFQNQNKRAGKGGRKIEKTLVAVKDLSTPTKTVSRKLKPIVRRSCRILARNKAMLVKPSDLPSSQTDMFSFGSPKKPNVETYISKPLIEDTSSSSDEDELIPGTQNVTEGRFKLSSSTLLKPTVDRKSISQSPSRSTSSITDKSDNGEKSIKFNLMISHKVSSTVDEANKVSANSLKKRNQVENSLLKSANEMENRNITSTEVGHSEDSQSSNQSSVASSSENKKTVASLKEFSLVQKNISQNERSYVLGSQKIITRSQSHLKSNEESKINLKKRDVPMNVTLSNDSQKARKRKAPSDDSEDSVSENPKSKLFKLSVKENNTVSSDDSRDRIYSRDASPDTVVEPNLSNPSNAKKSPLKPTGNRQSIKTNHPTSPTIQNKVSPHKKHSISLSLDSSDEIEFQEKRNNVREISPEVKETCSHPFNSTAYPEANDYQFPGNDISIIRRMSEKPVDSPIAKHVDPVPQPSNQRSILEFAKPKSVIISDNANSDSSTQDLLKTGYFNLKERFNFESGEGLFEEDLSEDVEVYIVQCPKEVEPSTLLGREINLRSRESVMKLSCHGKPIPFDVYCDLSDCDCSVSVVTPSRKQNKFTLNTIPVKGQLTIANAVDVPKIDEHPDSTDHRNSLLKNINDKSETSIVLETPSKKKVKTKNESHSIEEQLSPVNKTNDELETPKKKKNAKKNSYKEEIADALDTPSKKQAKTRKLYHTIEIEEHLPIDPNISDVLNTSSKKNEKAKEIGYNSEEHQSHLIQEPADASETPTKVNSNAEYHSSEELFDLDTADESETSSKKKTNAKEGYDYEELPVEENKDELETPSKKKLKARKRGHDGEEHLSQLNQTVNVQETPSKKKRKAIKEDYYSGEHLTHDPETAEVTPSKKVKAQKEYHSEEHLLYLQETVDLLETPSKKKSKAKNKNQGYEEYLVHNVTDDKLDDPSKKTEKHDIVEHTSTIDLSSDTSVILTKKKKKKKHLEHEISSYVDQPSESINVFTKAKKKKKKEKNLERKQILMNLDVEGSDEPSLKKKNKKRKHQDEIGTVNEADGQEVVHKKKNKKKDKRLEAHEED